MSGNKEKSDTSAKSGRTSVLKSLGALIFLTSVVLIVLTFFDIGVVKFYFKADAWNEKTTSSKVSLTIDGTDYEFWKSGNFRFERRPPSDKDFSGEISCASYNENRIAVAGPLVKPISSIDASEKKWGQILVSLNTSTNEWFVKGRATTKEMGETFCKEPDRVIEEGGRGFIVDNGVTPKISYLFNSLLVYVLQKLGLK